MKLWKKIRNGWHRFMHFCEDPDWRCIHCGKHEHVFIYDHNGECHACYSKRMDAELERLVNRFQEQFAELLVVAHEAGLMQDERTMH